MSTSRERQALVFLAALAVLGITVRAVRATRVGAVDPRGHEALDRQIAAVDAAGARRSARDARDARDAGDAGAKARIAKRPTRPTRPTRPRSDSNPSARLRTTPGDPQRHDSRRLSATDTGAEEPLTRYESRRRAVDESNAGSRARLAERALRLTPPASAAHTGSGRVRVGGETLATPVDLDTADELAISSIPWIGRSLASRIVADRARRGSFGSLQALQRVSGIGPRLSSRIAIYVTFSQPEFAAPRVVRVRRPHG